MLSESNENYQITDFLVFNDFFHLEKNFFSNFDLLQKIFDTFI